MNPSDATTTTATICASMCRCRSKGLSAAAPPTFYPSRAVFTYFEREPGPGWLVKSATESHTYQVSQNRSSWVFSGSTCGVAKDVSLFWRRRRWEREDDDGAGTEAWSVQPSGKEKHKSVCCSEKDKLLLCKLIKLNQLSKNTEAKVSKSYLN